MTATGVQQAADLPMLNTGMQRAPHLQLLAQVVHHRCAGGTQCLPYSHWVGSCASGKEEASDLQYSGACSWCPIAALQLLGETMCTRRAEIF